MNSREHLSAYVQTGDATMPSGGSDTVYRYLINSVTEYAIFAVSKSGEVLSWNAGAERHFGYTMHEIVGRPYDVIFTSEDRAKGAPLAELTEAAADGRADNDRWHVRKDGSRFWATNTVQPLRDDAGQVTTFTKIVRDTTEQYKAALALRQSEERLRLLIENVIDYAIFTTSPEGTITLWNAGAEKVFGYTSAEITGTNYARLFTDADVQLGVPRHNLDEASVRGSCSDDRWLVRKTGDRFYAGAKLTLIKDGSLNEGHGFVAVAHDMTLSKQFEQDQKSAAVELTRARDEALQAATLKGQFVATMSHEIRTPISGVIGMTELLLLTPLAEDQREYATVVRDSGQSLLRVINDILDYSKLEASKVELESVDFSLEGEIASVVLLMQLQYDQKKVTLTSHVDARLSRRVVGDPGRLRQVLTNIVGNALKFTPPHGRVDVDATTSVTAGDNEAVIQVHFSIRDTGIGIAPDVKRRLFEAFSQGDGSTTRKFGGTGLGLSICKQLVALMGGTIGCDSVQSQGATFWFILPFQQCGGAVTVAQPPARKADRRENIELRAERLLLVEDSEVNRLLATRQFERLRFEVTSVVNGREAVEAVRHGQYDLVFMDCHMPEMDGFQATKEIRMLEETGSKHLPIVAMTADAQMEDRKFCLASGMDDYVSKPASLADLRKVLETWLPRYVG